MDNNISAYPFGLGLLFDNDSDYFLSLPEETQLDLINQDIHSEENLHNCVEKFKLKE